MPSVAAISITPVKGLALQHPDEVLLTGRGVEENRRFHLIDAGGRLFNGKHCGRLVAARAELDGDRLAVVLPGGRVVAGEVAADGAVETSFYGRPVAGRLVCGPWAEALSGLAGEPLRLVEPDRRGDACDAFVATLLSRASCEELARRVGREIDHRRFRMLFTLDGCEPHEEDAWERVRLGEAVVRVAGPTGRCAVTTHDPATGVRDLDTLDAIKGYRGLREGVAIDFGVYAQVERPGRVSLGDSVEPL